MEKRSQKGKEGEAVAMTTVRYAGGMQFQAGTQSGHQFSMDAALEVGGENRGARPMEVLLGALGGCSGIDVVAMLQKMRVSIEDFAIELDGDRASVDPKVFQKIVLAYRLSSPDAKPEQLLRAVHLSQEKYCSASAMLEKAANLTIRVYLNGQELETFQRESHFF